MKKRIIIGDRWVGEGESCFIIAEIGLNHNGSIDLAKQMVDAATGCGVDAVKFQTFRADEIVSPEGETYTYRSQGKEVTESMHEMFKRYELSREGWVEIIAYCREKGVTFFSTPQNPSDLDLLLELTDLPVIKVGADDLTNLPLLKYYASKKKPLILSAGMAEIGEVEDAVNAVRYAGNDDLIVLHCVSSYPADAGDVNLRKMRTIADAFKVLTGFSDHTAGPVAATGAASLGARVIEKHFTLDKDLPGPDHWFSADPQELKELVEGVRTVEKALGSAVIAPTPSEQEVRRIARRSIVAGRDIEKGEIITGEMLAIRRPGTGLPPKFIDNIVGKKARNLMKKGELLDFIKVEDGREVGR